MNQCAVIHIVHQDHQDVHTIVERINRGCGGNSNGETSSKKMRGNELLKENGVVVAKTNRAKNFTRHLLLLLLLLPLHRLLCVEELKKH
jgi:hypothetical protein